MDNPGDRLFEVLCMRAPGFLAWREVVVPVAKPLNLDRVRQVIAVDLRLGAERVSFALENERGRLYGR